MIFQITNAYAVTEPIEKLSKNNKNLVVELYLGISVSDSKPLQR